MKRGKKSLPKRVALVVFCLFAISILQSWVVGAVPLSSQSTVAAAVSTCRTARFSDVADAALSSLRAQSGAQGVDKAVADCENKVRELRKTEEKAWLEAIDAKNKWDCVDARRLFKELSPARTFRQKEAAAELKRLGECGEGLPTPTDPDTALQYASDAAYGRRDFKAARETAWLLVARQDSIGKKARTLIQDLEQIEMANENLRQAERLKRLGKLDAACSLLLRTQQTYPTFPNMSEVRSKLSTCPTSPSPNIAAVPPTERQAALEKQVQEGRRFLLDGNIELAVVSLTAARRLSASDSTVAELNRDLETAKQARATIETGISLRKRGQYDDAIDRFKDAASLQMASGIGGWAHFELGVTLATQYFLNAGDSLKTAAQEEFRQSTINYSNPDFEEISPKIKELYDESVKGSKVG